MTTETTHPCQLCGDRHPPRYLFDTKATIPGGAKLTCPKCLAGMLATAESRVREECARVAERSADCQETYAAGKEEYAPVMAQGHLSTAKALRDIAAAIRALPPSRPI